MTDQCQRALAMLPLYLDSELSASESAWLGAHMGTCAECREAISSYVGIDREVRTWGERAAVRRRAAAWVPAAAAVLAAALLLALIVPQQRPTAPNRDDSRMVAIPYLPPLDPHENVTVVRTELPVELLARMGFHVAADPGATVSADVLVGEDGRAHAVRWKEEDDR